MSEPVFRVKEVPGGTTVECRFKAVHFIPILHRAPRWQQQNVNQTSHTQQTPHTSPSRAIYRNFEENWPRYNGTTLSFEETFSVMYVYDVYHVCGIKLTIKTIIWQQSWTWFPSRYMYRLRLHHCLAWGIRCKYYAAISKDMRGPCDNFRCI